VERLAPPLIFPLTSDQMLLDSSNVANSTLKACAD
jgi:hypothetical protein